MRSERATVIGTNPGDTLVVLLCPVEEELDRRVAGLAVGARIAAEAQKAGAQALWIVGDGACLSARTWDDIGRACGALEIVSLTPAEAETRLAARPGQPLLLLSASHLVPASLYPRLRAGASLAASGRVVAAGATAGTPLAMVDDASDGDHPEIIDLGDKAGATLAILRQTAKASDGIVSRFLNRPISRRISAALLAFDAIRPWHMTFATFLVTMVMFVALVLGGAGGLALGGMLFHLSSVLDGVDGEIARATCRSSERGAVLDSNVDMAGNLLFMAGLAIGLTRLYGFDYAYLGAWGFGSALIGFAALVALSRRAGQAGNFNVVKQYYQRSFSTGFPSRVGHFLTALISRDLFAFVFGLMALLGAAHAVLWIFSGFATFWMCLVLLATPGIHREVAALAVRPSHAAT